jgi:hypothetical protein
VIAYARSIVAGDFNQAQVVDITVAEVVPDPLMIIDSPSDGSAVGPSFAVSGWAVDRGTDGADTGVDSIHVWAFPAAGDPIFLGVATYGSSRPDVGAILGSQFTNWPTTCRSPEWPRVIIG